MLLIAKKITILQKKDLQSLSISCIFPLHPVQPADARMAELVDALD